MTASLYQNVRAALTFQALTASGLPTSRQYEGLVFKPIPGVAYVRFTLMPTQAPAFDVGGSVKAHQGLFQIDLFYPPSDTATRISGTGDQEAMADTIMALFKPTTRLFQNNVEVKITTSDRAAILGGLDFDQLPITVRWRCFAPS